MKLVIDGKAIVAPAGSTILEAARAADVYIPSLCAHPQLPAAGSAGAAFVYRGAERIESDGAGSQWDGCGLCAVEVDGGQSPVRACATPAADGMAVVTASERLTAHRRNKLHFLLIDHPHACLTCAQAEGCPRTQCSSNVPEPERCCELFGSCELQRVAQYVGVPPTLPRYRPRGLPALVNEPLFDNRTELCVNCLRCVRACADLREVGALSFAMRGGRPIVGTAVGPTRAESHCRFCGACVEVCPTGALTDKVPAAVPCREACPIGIDVPRLLRHVSRDEPDKAAAVIRERTPFARTLSYACFHPCEDACRRGEVNAPLSVCRLKRYAVDNERGAWRSRLKRAAPTGKYVAVVGSGPAGLTAAYYLSRKGHRVTVFESLPEPGGMLRYGIPEYRLPREVLERDLDEIRDAGIEIRVGTTVSGPADLEGHDEVFIASGAQLAKRIKLPGSDLDGVLWGVDFLRDRDAVKGLRVVVVGGGNVAIDAARVARRLGARSVTMVSLESAQQLPAWSWEVEEAREEGVELLHGWGPARISDRGVEFKLCTRVFDEQGRFSPQYDENRRRELPAEAVILAIGQDPSSAHLTKLEGVYAGGDVVTGPRSVVEACAAGRKAAEEIDRALGGDGDVGEKLLDDEPVLHALGRVEGFAELPRREPARAEGAARACSFAAIEDAFAREAAMAEASRCLSCDLRLAIAAASMPPHGEALLAFTAEAVAGAPEVEGVFQLLDEGKKVVAIKGVMNLRAGLGEAIQENKAARFFAFEKEPMYTKRESELIQQYLQEHGELPGGGAGELDDLY